MPLFYFHVADVQILPDEVGVELRDVDAARVEAISVAGSMLRDYAVAFWRTGEWRVIVTDENHHILFTIACQALAGPVPPLKFDPHKQLAPSGA